MGNRIYKPKLPQHNFIAAEFLKNKIWNDGYKQFYKTKHLEKEIKYVCNVACKQLNRNNEPLTKTDLISILIKINPIYTNEYDELHKYLSINDLNFIIRYEIYNNCIKDIFENKKDPYKNYKS